MYMSTKSRAFFLSTTILSLSIFATTQNTLVDVQSLNPSIKKEIFYTTNDNFTGHKVYPSDYCYLHKDAATQLSAVQNDLEIIGLGLKIWDGFRPMLAQRKFWELLPDPRYVADPSKGGRHTRGTAVDCTIIRLSDGKELEMPTTFDDFSEKAHSSYDGASQQAIANRQRLQNIMRKHGFTGIKTEWWHFDLVGWNKRDANGNELYPVIELDFFDLHQGKHTTLR